MIATDKILSEIDFEKDIALLGWSHNNRETSIQAYHQLAALCREQRLDSERLSEMLLERFNREAELGSEIESLTRQLAEAREKTIEEIKAHFTPKIVYWGSEIAAEIDSLKPQPNQTEKVNALQ